MRANYVIYKESVSRQIFFKEDVRNADKVLLILLIIFRLMNFYIMHCDPQETQFAYSRYRCNIYMVSRLHFVALKRGHAEIVHDVISNLSHTLIPFTHNTCYVLYVLLCPLTTLRVYKNTEILSRFSFCFDFSS